MNMNQSELLAAPVLHAKRLQQAKVAADNAIGRAADRVDRESPEWIAAWSAQDRCPQSAK